MLAHLKTSQELRMLSTVTVDCQVTKIAMNSGSQLSELQSVSHMSQVSKIVFLCQVMSSHHSDQMSQRSQVCRIVPYCQNQKVAQSLGCSLMEVHR